MSCSHPESFQVYEKGLWLCKLCNSIVSRDLNEEPGSILAKKPSMCGREESLPAPPLLQKTLKEFL